MMTKEYPIKIKIKNFQEYKNFEGKLIEMVYCKLDGAFLRNRFPIKGIVIFDVYLASERVIIKQTTKKSHLVHDTMRFKVFSDAEKILFKLENDL